ncbi:MAG TPA: anti-sigma factor antagonist [Neobacillus sp.]|jgi:anti-sigma B factor antagonist
MNITIDKQDNQEKIFVLVGGEIDAFTAPKLREELVSIAEGQNISLIINLKDVSYIDSTGLGVFIGIYKLLKQNDGELKLINLSARLERLFEITGLSNIIDIASN